MVNIPNTDLFTKAIVRRPAKSMVNGITTANLGTPDYDLAVSQHNDYVNCLKECGLDVVVLDQDEDFPDSVFIEDTAVLTDKVAIITRPRPASRQGETDRVSDVLIEMFDHFEYIEEPGTLEGGDVMKIGEKFFIGISDRTNKEGATQLVGILESFGYQGFKVPMGQLLHLKTGISYLGDDTVLIGKELIQKKQFKPYKKIKVDDAEAYAANCIRVNEYVIVPSGFPKTVQMLTSSGFEVKELEMSEFRKLDGGLSCLSLRF